MKARNAKPTDSVQAKKKPSFTDPVPEKKPFPSWWIPLVAALLILATFWNALRGDFVYDDRTQILQNTHIRESRYYAQALTEDVWAFKGSAGEARSNYWRPAFVAWLILNYRMFGPDPYAWHVMNLLLHFAVCFLLWLVLKELRVPAGAQAAMLWIFAVHPVHVESVTWISGSTDLLLALFLAASLLCFLRAVKAPSTLLELSWLLYLLALFSKESAVLFPLVIAVVGVLQPESTWKVALRRAAPYLLLAAAFLVVRTLVLRQVAMEIPWAASRLSMFLTIPLLLAFYLRQALFPLFLGPSYSIHPVTPESLGAVNFLLPVAVVAGFLALAWKFLRSKYRLNTATGMTMFFVLLAPALYIRGFLPEQLAHDRYLYLPLFGLLLMLLPQLSAWVSDRRLAAGGLAVCIPLAVLTAQYNEAYRDELSFRQFAAERDPGSATAWAELGDLLRKQGKLQESHAALEHALNINPEITEAIYNMAMIDAAEGRDREAEMGFKRILAVFPDYEPALDQLAVIYDRQRRLPELIDLMEHARRAVPYRRVKYTQNLAVAQYRSGDIDRALSELESVRSDLAHETDPKLLECWFYLADLYRIRGRNQDARNAAQGYLHATSGMDSQAARLRGAAENLIRSLPEP